MLDRRVSLILFYLNDKCSEGEYKIFSVSELLGQLSGRNRTDAEGLAEDVKYLVEHGYINCKYQDETQYCIVPLNKGRLYTEEAAVVKQDKKTRRHSFVLTVFGGLCGGFLGSMIWGLISIFI